MRVQLELESLRRVLVAAVVALPVAGLVVEAISNAVDNYDLYGWAPLFSLSREGNVPNWYSAMALLLAALMLAAVASVKARQGAPFRRHWRGLALVILYVSLDEWVSIHEHFNQFIDTGGVLYFSWIIPFGILALVFALVYLRFLFHLPARTRRLFATAGAIYVFGAIGMEMPLGYWSDYYGTENLGYALIDWVEETLEMIGASMFLWAVAAYFHEHVREVTIATAASAADPPRPGGSLS